LVELVGEYEFPVPPAELWDALQDPDLLARVLPGCQRLEKVGDNEFKGNLKITVGPVQGAFQGTIVYANMSPPESLNLVINTRGPSGIVNGEGSLVLTATDTGTMLRYQGEAQVGGRIASVSQRLMESSARAITKQSLQSLERQVAAQVEPEVETTVAGETAVTPQAPSSTAAPPPPSQTEFMLGVTKEVFEEYIPNPLHRKLLARLAMFIGMLIMMEWCTSKIARKTAKILQEKE
jgi:carbon monoxide dehydrogenase subunit G